MNMSVYDLRLQIIHLQKQVDWLAAQLAQPTLPKRQFKKPFINLCDRETQILHVVRPQVVGRVVVIMGASDAKRIVTYDQEGFEIEALCGSFQEVGLDVLDKAGTKRWEVQYPAAPSQ